MPEIILKEPGLYEIRNEDAIYIYCRSEGNKRIKKYHYKFYCKIGKYKAEHKLDFNIDKNVREKIQNKEDLFSFEIVPILTKLKKELSQQSKDLVLLSKIEEARDFFDSNQGFIESVDTLVQLRLKSPDNIKYWEIALKQLNDRLQEKVKNLLNIKNKDATSGNLDELSEEDSAESPNAYRNFFIKSIRPLISELIKIFFIHSEYFAAARYKVIAVCEEILFHLPDEQDLSLDLYHILSNVHSYIDHDWRREQYNVKFCSLAKELNKYEQFPIVHKNEEEGHAGLRRMVHFFDNNEIDIPESVQRSARRLDSYKPNIVDIKISSGQHVVYSISGSNTLLKEWTEIPKFSVITGVNGCGKTKILDSIDHALRNIGQPVGLLGAYLYADSESDLLRNVFGKRGNDFKYDYVHEKIIFYLDFENFQQRKRITQEASENLSAKIALAIVDRILCKTEDQLDYNWISIIRDITKKRSDKEKLDFLATKVSSNFILKVAEELTFRLNAITEPISFVKNICTQHLSLVQGIYDPNPSTKNNNKYNKDCIQYVKEHYLIIPPIENINIILQKYLKNFRIKYKWKENYKYKLLYNHDQIIDSSELGFYLNSNNNLYCKILDEDQPLWISKSKIGEALYEKITTALQDKKYIDIDNEDSEGKLLNFISSNGYLPGSYELIFYKDKKEIHVQNLSSGELVIIKLILWSYVSRGLDFSVRQHEIITERQKDYFANLPQNIFDTEEKYLTRLVVLPSKLSLLLLDEVDKHFDPKLSRSLMDILRHEFIDDQGRQAQVIMTTHKPDTLALVPTEDHSKIFTIQQKGDQTEIVETHKLLAMYRLAGNLREVIGHRFEVCTESTTDAYFYTGVYSSLMQISSRSSKDYRPDAPRDSIDSTVIPKNLYAENLYSDTAQKLYIGRALSQRYQMIFRGVSKVRDGNHKADGGCSQVAGMIGRDYTSAKYGKAHNEELFADKEFHVPYGIIDADARCFEMTQEVIKDKDEEYIKDRIVYPYDFSSGDKLGSRYSIENFLFDPLVLCSTLDKAEIKEFIDSSLITYEYRDKMRKVCSYIKWCVKSITQLKETILQNAIDKYFNIIFQSILNVMLALDYEQLLPYLNFLLGNKGKDHFLRIKNNSPIIKIMFDEIFSASKKEVKKASKPEYISKKKLDSAIYHFTNDDAQITKTFHYERQLPSEIYTITLKKPQSFSIKKLTSIEIPFEEKVQKTLREKDKKKLKWSLAELKTEESICEDTYELSASQNAQKEIIKKIMDQFDQNSQIIKDVREIRYVFDFDGQIYIKSFIYPKVFLQFRGHYIEDYCFSHGLADQIAMKVKTNGLNVIPMDLAQVFFDLNHKVRANVRSIIKPPLQASNQQATDSLERDNDDHKDKQEPGNSGSIRSNISRSKKSSVSSGKSSDLNNNQIKQYIVQTYPLLSDVISSIDRTKSIITVEGKGNCLFNAIFAGMTLRNIPLQDITNAQALRNKLAHWYKNSDPTVQIQIDSSDEPLSLQDKISEAIKNDLSGLKNLEHYRRLIPTAFNEEAEFDIRVIGSFTLAINTMADSMERATLIDLRTKYNDLLWGRVMSCITSMTDIYSSLIEIEGVWGRDIDIFCLTKSQNIRISVSGKNENRIFGDSGLPLIALEYVNGDHYDLSLDGIDLPLIPAPQVVDTFFFEVVPINPLLSIPNLLVITRKITGSMEAVNRLITLGEDSDIAEQIIDAINDRGIEEVINLFFSKPENSQKSIPLLLEDSSSRSTSPQRGVPSTAIAGIISLDLLESSPTIKYFINEILKIDIELPKINNGAWIAAHFVIGATTTMLLETLDYTITDKLIISGMNSVNYGVRMQLYNSVDKIGLLPTIAIQALLTLANNPIHQVDNKHILYNVAISASISGMQYYQYHYSDPNKETTITETVLPYALDIAAAIFAIRGINLPDNNHIVSYVFFTKQALMAISSVVTIDYTSKILLSFVSDQIKKAEDYIHSCFGNTDTYEEINSNIVGEINNAILEG